MTDIKTETPKKDDSPNADWKNNPNLDDNGNPIEEGQVPPVEKQTEDEDIKPITGDEETPDADEETPVEEEEAPTPVAFNKDLAKQVESFLTDAGLTPSEVAKQVTLENGAVPIDVMKALVEKHGEAVAGLIGDKLAALHDSNVSAAAASDKVIFDHVAEAFKGVTDQSGDKTFKELSGWAKKNMSAADRTAINQMLGQGGFQAKAAIDILVQSFNNSETTIKSPVKKIEGDSTSKEYGQAPLDKHEYNTQLRKLLGKGKSETSPEIVALNKRRDKSRARGH